MLKGQETLISMSHSVLLYGVESLLKKRIFEFLPTVGCRCGEAGNVQEVQQAAFDALLLGSPKTAGEGAELIAAVKQIWPHISGRALFIGEPLQMKQFLQGPLPYIPREASLPQLWAKLQEIFASQAALNSVPRGMVPAQLIYDSFQSPPLFGIRCISTQESCRQLAYQHNSTKVNLLIHGSSERVSVTGQVLDVSLRDVNARPVLLHGPAGELNRTITSQYGEFTFDFGFVRDASLRIHLSEGAWLYMPLEDMDWLKKIG
ncbi:MAG TPA: hypothetical protein VFB79_22660 [Candidatus Angelobacter sp.]|nr:hypothetical protein [Candidatus Angelobacter sp.]